MMRILVCLLLLVTLRAQAGDSTRLYNPKANAAHDVAQQVERAKAENKNVLLLIGGNWCVMCYRFNAFVKTDSTLKNLLDQHYVVYHLNYSPENKNLAYLRTIGNPQRFGFPVLVVLDGAGKPLYTQDTGLLGKGNGYSFEKVKAFLEKWAPAQVSPEAATE